VNARKEPESVGDSGPSEAGRRAAIFDLDGTLVVGQTTVLLVKFLRRNGVVSRAFLLGTALWFLGYRLGFLKVTEKSRNQGGRVFEGRSVAEVEDLMGRFVEEVLAPRFHAGATAALLRHQDEGDRVVVISAALEPVVGAVCRRLGVSEYVGTPCETSEGLYTGRLLGPSPHAGEKVRLAKEFFRRWDVDPEACWAYADHETDLELLRAVGYPVAVDPRPALLDAAVQAGWPVLQSPQAAVERWEGARG